MKGKEIVFRQRMVERLSATDELSEPLRLDPLRGWPLIAAVLVLLMMAAVWALGTSSPLTVHGVGIVELHGESGTYQALLYTSFQRDIQPGQPVRLETLFGDSMQLNGHVLAPAHEPSIRGMMETDLGDPDLAQRLYDQGQRQRISVELVGLEGTDLTNRRQVTARIEVGRRRPIEDLFPSLTSPSTVNSDRRVPRVERVAYLSRGGSR